MKKNKITLFLTLALIFFSHAAKNVLAHELLTNGGFENGLTGWTVVNSTNPFRAWQSTVGGTTTDYHTSSPQEGTRSAWNGVAGNVPTGTYTLTQQFTIPPGTPAPATITWKHRFQLDNASLCTTCGTAFFRVQILNSSGTALQTLYIRNVGSGQIVDTGWLTQTFSLNAYIGQTIQIRFENQVTQTYAGPGMAEIDAVSVQANIVTAADASVSGRVTTDGGRGISMANVTLTDMSGNSRTVTTNQFGTYYFDAVESGQNYVVRVENKKYTFSPNNRVINVNDDARDVDFQANP